jgi:predicted nucleic acid-binding protein
MEPRYLIDSNVIIDYSANQLPQKGSDFVEEIFNTSFQISVLVKIEVLGFADVPDKMQAMSDFVNTAAVLALDEKITQQTILLRRIYKKIKLGDAVIAAKYLEHNMVLISHNITDFKKYTRAPVN